MAVVKTEDVWLETGGRFKRVVKFTASVKDKAQRFTCAYPPDVAQALSEPAATGVGVEEVVLAWKDGLKRALDAKKTVARVILFEIETRGIIHRDGKEVFHVGGGYNWNPDRATQEGLAITIAVGVYDEATIVLGKETRYTYKSVPSSLPHAARPEVNETRVFDHRFDHIYGRSCGDTDDDCIPEKLSLPWSEQNEAWFAGLVTATENLILRLNTLRRDRKALQESIDRGRGLLAAAPEGL